MGRLRQNPNSGDPTVVRLMGEVNQTPRYRQKLIAKLEQSFGNKCVTLYFTSFDHPAIIEDPDADIIEGVLQKCDLSNGLVMVINSPGGDGLAAERIVNVCRSYTGNKFEVVVPRTAKSAATMICMGANKIWMTRTSELGPIDPQIVQKGSLVSAYNIINSYETLLDDAVNTSGNLEPFLQQLARYDATQISQFKSVQRLTEDIAIQALATGMLTGESEVDIKAKIQPFLDPTVTSVHGRRIGIEQVRKSGLVVEEIPLNDERFHLIWEVYIRAEWCVANRCSKLVQTKKHNFETPLDPTV